MTAKSCQFAGYSKSERRRFKRTSTDGEEGEYEGTYPFCGYVVVWGIIQSIYMWRFETFGESLELVLRIGVNVLGILTVCSGVRSH